MQNITLIPLSGIELNGITIPLSASRKEVKNVLGEPYETLENSLFYFHNELRFDFDNDGKVNYIEFLGGIDGNIQPVIYGVYAFESEADDLFHILREKNHGDISDQENGYSYRFLNISVGVFRPLIPEAVKDMIEEADEDGYPMDEEEIKCELRKAAHWATIGIGIANYYR